MDKSQPGLYYFTYDQIKENKDVPKSFFQFWCWLFSQTVKGLRRRFLKNIFTLFLVMLVTFLINSIYLVFINDTMYLGSNGTINSLFAYFFSGFLEAFSQIKGFQFVSIGIPNIFWTLPLAFLLSGLIFNIFRRIRDRGFKKLMGDIFNSGKLAKVYATGSSKDINYFILSGCFWATIIGFIIQNPITLFILPMILFLSFTLKEKSKIISLLSTYLIAINIKKKKQKNVNIGNIALSILGLSIGLVIYFILVVFMWIVFDYSLLARVIFTLILAVMFFLLKRANKINHTSKVIKASFVVFSFVCISTLLSQPVYADDGGWVESGKSLMGWLANPGSKIISKLGLSQATAAGLGWIADTALGGLANHFNVGELMTLAGLGAESSSAESLGKAALGAALGPVGSLMGDTWGGVNDALAGAGAESDDSGSSGSSGSGSSSGSGDSFGKAGKGKSNDNKSKDKNGKASGDSSDSSS